MTESGARCCWDVASATFGNLTPRLFACHSSLRPARPALNTSTDQWTQYRCKSTEWGGIICFRFASNPINYSIWLSDVQILSTSLVVYIKAKRLRRIHDEISGLDCFSYVFNNFTPSYGVWLIHYCWSNYFLFVKLSWNQLAFIAITTKPTQFKNITWTNTFSYVKKCCYSIKVI